VRAPTSPPPFRLASLRSILHRILLSLLLVAATTAGIMILMRFVDLGRVGIIYLVPVLVAATRWGIVPALIAAMSSVAASAFFFYAPIYSLHVQDWEQLVDLMLFTLVAIVISQLAATAKRHAEIAARTLNEAKMRAETEHLRDALIGSVSHELRTPLASILGAASVLAEAPAVTGERRLAELANVVREEADRLNNDIQNLLDATRISSEGVRPNPEWIDPADVVNLAVERRRRRLAGNRVEIEVAGDLPLLYADPVLVDQALGQVLDNAAKYSPPGSTILIRADGADDRVVIVVRDAGAGLIAEERQHLLKRFYRGPRHATTTSGSGLGLWIANAFVAACGGTVEVESEGVDRGTKVSLSFSAPLRSDAASGLDA
jgi:K+-sensing histidine kinase KdpD